MASLLCGLSFSIGSLIGSRFIQGIGAVILGIRCIPVDRVPAKSGPFDYPGAIIFLFAPAVLLGRSMKGLTLGWTSPAILGSFGISAVLWVLFILREIRRPGPALRLRPVPEHQFLAASLAAAAMMLTFAGVDSTSSPSFSKA